MLICTYFLRNTPHVPGMLIWVGVNMILVAIRWGLIYVPIDRKYKTGDGTLTMLKNLKQRYESLKIIVLTGITVSPVFQQFINSKADAF